MVDSLVPPARLARLLVQTREASGRALDDIAAATGGRFDMTALHAVEAGHRTVDDEDLRVLGEAYGVDLGEIPVQRTKLLVDPDEGLLVVGGTRRRFKPSGDEELLMRYLALVYKMREARLGVPISPRSGDLEVLASVLGCSPDEVRERLITMMSERVGELQKIDRSLARRVVVPVLGVVVAASTVGGLLLVRSGEVPNPAQSSQITVPASDLGVEIGDSMVIQK